VIATPHIYIYATAMFIVNFITAQRYGHNFGPDALARKQCRARVLAALGRALGVGPHGQTAAIAVSAALVLPNTELGLR
jgi:hypothetical protein